MYVWIKLIPGKHYYYKLDYLKYQQARRRLHQQINPKAATISKQNETGIQIMFHLTFPMMK